MFKLYILWAKIVAFIFGGRSVWIQDFEGETKLRTAYKSPFGWIVKIYPVSLPDKTTMVMHDNGTLSGVSYMKRWRWA